MASALVQIERKIRAATDAVVRSIADTDDGVAGAIIGRNMAAHLLINSSFLYRDKSVKTTQSSRRLVARVGAAGKHVRLESLGVVDNQVLRTHYKLLSQQNVVSVPLSSAIAHEIGSIGDLLFILLGTIEGLRPQAQEINSSKVKEIRLAPSLTGATVQKTEAGVYSLRKIVCRSAGC